ncbi:hypothetical protein GQ457_08G020750 [Hibiscus cannabinus]
MHAGEVFSQIDEAIQSYYELCCQQNLKPAGEKPASVQSKQKSRAYTMQIKEICDLLASCGSPVSAVKQIATILNGLPPEYDPFITVISASREPYTVENIVQVLVDVETRLVDPFRLPIDINNIQFVDDSSRADQTSRPPAIRYKGGRFKGRPRPQCQLCGKLGHIVDRC